MRCLLRWSKVLTAAAMASCIAGEARSQALTSMQGVLRTDTGQPVNGSNLLRLSLYSSPAGGTALQEIRQTVDVSQGVFTATLGFDPQLFGAAEERWVEIGVQTGPGVFETLTPRQRIGAAPLALTIPGLQVTSRLVVDQTMEGLGPFASPALNDGVRWQSFTTGGTGEIRAVDASVQNTTNTGATITAKLYRGLGVNGTPVAVTTAILSAFTGTSLRFTFPAAVSVAAEEVFTLELSSPAPILWFVQRNTSYVRGESDFEPNADYRIITYLSNRAAGSEFSFNGSITASTVRGTDGSFSQGVLAGSLNATNASITDTVSASTLSSSILSTSTITAGSITANSITANTFNVPTLTSSFFLGTSMALTTNAGIGLTNPSPDVRLEILKQNVGSGWHMYLTNFGAPPQFNRTGMRVTEAGFFEMSNTISGPNFARLSGTGAWSAVSDARLKTDVTPAEGMLDAALKLRPVHFRWLADGKRDTGFIAQEVQGILPGFVFGDEATEMLTVDYSHLSVVAIGAVQELEAKVARLERENRELREFRERIEKLEAAMKRLPPAKNSAE